MSSLSGLSRTSLGELIGELGEPTYRVRQVFEWVQARGAADYEAMSNVSKRLRSGMADRMPVRSTKVRRQHPSGDGTSKLLVELADGQAVECVLIPEGDRRTGCISTQVGCGVGCVFCASGAKGVIRNLDTAEIVEQVHHLAAIAGAPLTHIVVMGIGEPLHNVAPLVEALRIFQDPWGLDFSPRRITISTSGPRRGFAELMKSGLRVKLAISLHAPFDDLRKELVPRGGSGTIRELQNMAAAWFKATGRDVTFEYVLIAGVNDSDDHARALARLCGRNRNVNVIPMNAVPFAPTLRAPSPARTEAFAEILRNAGVPLHLRRQRGDDVAAACGQLRLADAAGG